MLSPALIERILYAKYFLYQGYENTEKNLPITDGIAVSNFQDATEMLLRTIAEHVNASLKDNANFNLIIDRIEDAPQNHRKIKVPNRTSLNQLNKARVNFKHFGLLPKTSDVQKFRHDIELFFHLALQEFFDMTLDEVSMTTLVKRHRVKNHLLHAEKYLMEEKFSDSINSSAKAFIIAMHNIFERSIYSLSPFDRLGDRKLEDVIRKLCKLLQEHQDQLKILKFGINAAEYERFKSLTPDLSVSAAGIPVGYLLSSTQDIRSLEDARLCLRFSIDAALRIQQNPLPIPKKTLIKESLRKFRAIQPTSMLVHPASSNIERIRNVEVEEVLIGYYKNYDQDDHVAILDGDDIGYVPCDTVEEITNG